MSPLLRFQRLRSVPSIHLHACVPVVRPHRSHMWHASHLHPRPRPGSVNRGIACFETNTRASMVRRPTLEALPHGCRPPPPHLSNALAATSEMAPFVVTVSAPFCIHCATHPWPCQSSSVVRSNHILTGEALNNANRLNPIHPALHGFHFGTQQALPTSPPHTAWPEPHTKLWWVLHQRAPEHIITSMTSTKKKLWRMFS